MIEELRNISFLFVEKLRPLKDPKCAKNSKMFIKIKKIIKTHVQ